MCTSSFLGKAVGRSVAAWLLAALVATGAHADADSARNAGAAWLIKQQQGDGSWANASGDLEVQATSAAIMALKNAGQSRSPTFRAAVSWLSNADSDSIDSISRKIEALSAAGQTSTAQKEATRLYGLRADSRLAAWSGYGGVNVIDVVDTALGLGALRVGDAAYSTKIYVDASVSSTLCNIVAKRVLLSAGKQAWPLSFSSAAGQSAGQGRPSVVATALLVSELRAIEKTTPVTNGSCSGTAGAITYTLADIQTQAVAWLLDQQNADGGFGEQRTDGSKGGSNVLTTALVYKALVNQAAPASTQVNTALNWLLGKQSATTGSWDGDALVTASVVSSLASANGTHLVDADKDGLTDRVETQLGSNAAVADARNQLNSPSLSVAGSTTSAFSVNATVGQAFSHGLGGAGSYSLASGSLPPGLQLNPSTGQITGTPSQAGSYSFEYQAAANGDQVIGRIDVAEVVPATDGDVPVPLWALLTLGASLLAAAHRKARLPEAGIALKGLLSWLPVLFLALQSFSPDDAHARQAALSTLIPDQTAQQLRGGLSTTESSSRQAMHRAMRQKLKELGDEVGASVVEANRAANLASNEAGPAATGLSRRAAQHRADIQPLRQQQLQELRALKDQVQQMAGSEKAAEVQALISQVTARFDRLDAALAKLGAAQSRRENRHAHVELEALLRTLREPEPTSSQAPVPTLMRAPIVLREPGKGSISKVLPQYALQMMDEYRAAHNGQAKRPGAAEGDQVVADDLGGMAPQGYGFIKAAMNLPAVSPNAAGDCSTTAADLADDGVEVQLTPEIRALAQSLQYSPVRILKWMLKEIEFEPYWGSLKGAKGVLQTRRGNATDQSSLLVALLRASNVPARFVRGTVSLADLQPADNANGRAQRWLGTQNYSASIRYLGNNQGIPADGVALGTGAATQGVFFDHVWVQACVPFAAYRGNLANSGGHRWLPMDPSVKDHDYQAGMAVNVSTDSSFYAGYLAKRTDQLPPDYLADKTESVARLTKPDASREDVPYRGPLRAPKIDILPSTTPLYVESFSNWPGSSSPESATIPDAHRHKFTVAVQSAAGANLATKTFSLPQNVLSKITVSYVPDVASQALWNSWGGALSALPAGAVNVYPQVKADGVLAATGTATLGLGSTHKVVMKIAQGEVIGGTCIADSGVPTDAKDTDATCINKTVYTNLKAGGYFALGFNASQVSDASLASQAQSLITGVNTNATAPTPASAAAYDATVGQLLHLVLQNYIQGITLADEQIAELKGFRSNKRYDLGLTGSQIKTDYVFDLPLTVKPAGVYVDFKGGRFGFTKLASAAPTQPNAGETAANFSVRRTSVGNAEIAGMGKLSIYAGSALEHRVWQEALRTDAVSTVRGLQFANENGNPLVTFTPANIGQYASLMQMSGATSMAANETAIRNEVNAGATVTVSKAQIAYTDPVDTAKAWRGYVYMSENDTAGIYGAIIDGDLAGGFPLLNSAPITSVYNPPPAAPSFQSTTNSGLGLLTTLTPGTQGSNSFATWVGDPVNMLTGNFTHHESDLHIKGRGGLPIVLERWYNSGEPKDGPLGFGWTHSFNHALKLYGVEGSPGAAKVSWLNGSGGEQYFSTTSHSNGDIARGAVLTNPAGVEVQISRISGGANDGKFQIKERDGTVYLFASATGPNEAPSASSAVVARLLSITDRNGNALTLGYNASNQLSTVTDSIGRTVLSFAWSGSRISQVTDLGGRKVTYAYTDGNNNLTQVTDALNQAHRYSYYTAADGSKLANHLKRHTLPRGNGMEFAYYSGGQVFKHTPFGVDGSLIPESATTFHYNLFNRESWSVNGRGEEHHITFDSFGNPQRIVEESGAIHTYTYDSANPYNRLTETDSIGRTTRYTYTVASGSSPKNLVETVTAPSGAVSEYRDYNSFAQPQRIKDVLGNWTWQKFDATGNQTDSIRLRSGVTPVVGTQPAAADIVAWTRQSFDTAGNVTTRTQVSDFSSAAAGSTNVGPSLTHNWDANKLNISSITRKGKRNGTSAAASITETSPTFTYDTLGRQLSGIDGNWYPSNQTWDNLGRITAATDSLGKTRKFVYDANGNPTASELVDGGARVDASSSRFDGQDRLIGMLDYAGNRSFFSYDAVGNRTAQTSPDNYTLSFEYDAANRPVAAFDAEENRVYTQLDTQGRPLAVTDPNGHTVSYQYWGSSTGSAGTYAADGRLKRVTQPAIAGQAAGRATEYDYDAAGNVIRTRAVAADGSSSR
jgi:YD repeat-containing protein